MRHSDIAFGSIYIILFVILETYLTVSILVFWYLIFCIHLTRKYWCKYTNMQYCGVKPAADDYVTLLYVFVNSLTRWHSIWINLCYPFCYIGNLSDFIYTCILEPLYFAYICIENIDVNVQICNTVKSNQPLMLM